MRRTLAHVGWKSDESSAFVQRYADQYKLDVVFVGLASDFFKDVDLLKNASFAFIWNGQQGHGFAAIEVCKRLCVPYVCYEWGILDQKDHFMLDPTGFNAQSSLMGALPNVDSHPLETTRRGLQALYPLKPQGHVLAPLQIHNDTQVLFNTSQRNMNQYLCELAAMYPEQRVAIKIHPKSSAEIAMRGDHQFLVLDEDEGNFLGHARIASVVVSLTSTCLVEAHVLGVPVVALGDCPFRQHQRDDHDRLAACYLANNVLREDDPTPIIEKFGIYPR